ncbi:MAG TPA: right-handed parallel beta-helix repeat-containing protein [Burkholderiales bacterium]|nr:right-handed parallel beta-helix repeat-containing protein [Burkholderiales bacterium]
MATVKQALTQRMIFGPIAKTAFVITALAIWSSHASSAFAATYYVDPASGNDSNAGTSQSSPWKTIPGTRNTGNSGWLRSAWGSISSSSKLQPGDVIQLKAGGAMGSSVGGRLLIDGTYYNNGSANAPIIIQVSPSWGSGNFTYDMSGVSPEQWSGLIHIQDRSHIQIKGAGAGKRFVVKNANGLGVNSYGSSGNRQQGIVFDYLEIAGSKDTGLNMSYSDNWRVSNTISHDNGTLGFGVGGLADQATNNGQFIDSEAYGNGKTDDGSGIRHGFGLYGGTNISYIRCKARNNGRDGFDFGTTSNNSNTSATVIDSSAYDNGEDGFGSNGGGSSNVYTYINSVAFNNAQAGWNIYGGADSSLYNCISHHNGSQNGYGGNFMIYAHNHDGKAAYTKAKLRNCIGYKPKAYANVYSYNSDGLPTSIDSDYNIFVPRSSDSETFAETPFGSTFSYANKPNWVGSHDKVGIAHDPKFAGVSTSSFAGNDYHLASGSGPAINAGIAISGIATWTKDRDGKLRASPPEAGLYEYGGTVKALAAPTNLRVMN